MDVWVTIIVALVIFIIDIIWDKLRERSKQPIWYYKTVEIISKVDKLSDQIQIFFKGQRVTQISATRIGLVNIGKEAIDNIDVKTPGNQIKVIFDKDIQILQEPKVIKKHRESIDFTATSSDAEVLLTFNLLDQMDGAVTEVIHTGNRNTKVSIPNDQIISGVPKGISERSSKYASNKSKRYNSVSLLILFALLIFILWNLIPAFIKDISQNNLHRWSTLISVLLVIGVFSWAIYHVKEFMRSIPGIFDLEI